MEVGKEHAGEKWTDVLGWHQGEITIDEGESCWTTFALLTVRRGMGRVHVWSRIRLRLDQDRRSRSRRVQERLEDRLLDSRCGRRRALIARICYTWLTVQSSVTGSPVSAVSPSPARFRCRVLISPVWILACVMALAAMDTFVP